VLLENGQVVVGVGDVEGAQLVVEDCIAEGFVMVDVTVMVEVELGLDQFEFVFLHEQYIRRASSLDIFIAVACRCPHATANGGC
jgi:hypothetical protein